jgi:hypothetical protein
MTENETIVCFAGFFYLICAHVALISYYEFENEQLKFLSWKQLIASGLWPIMVFVWAIKTIYGYYKEIDNENRRETQKLRFSEIKARAFGS